MTRSQRWFYERIVPHLDDPSTRRSMVWMLAAVFVVIACGPLFSRAQTALLAPDIKMVQTWNGDMVPNPVILKATVSGEGVLNVSFRVYKSGNTAASLMDVQAAPSPVEPGTWLYTAFNGEPGVRYYAKAHGTWGANNTSIESSNAVSFTIAPASTVPVVTPTTTDTNQTNTPPAGSAGTNSLTPTSAPPGGPALPLGITIVSPPGTIEPPVFQKYAPLSASITNGPASSVIFHVSDAALGTELKAAAGSYDNTNGVWRFFYMTDNGGLYIVRADATASDGRTATSDERGFRIAVPVTPTISPTTTATIPTTTPNVAPTSTRETAPKTLPLPPTPPKTETVVPTTTETKPEVVVPTNLCGDGRCVLPETIASCPKDCHAPKVETKIETKPVAPVETPKPEPVKSEPIEVTTTPPVEPVVKRPEVAVTPIVPEAAKQIAQECVTAGINADRCDIWLAAKYQNQACVTAGIITREACDAYLKAKNQTVDLKSLVGFASADQVDQARKDVMEVINKPVDKRDLTQAVQDAIQIEVKPEQKILILAPAAPEKPNVEASIGLVIQDADGDGLPDDVEKRIGTDPNKADTDGDGFSDGAEVRGGYNPLGPGKLGEEKKLAPIEDAVLNGKAIEEPRGQDQKIDATYKVDSVETPASTDASADKPNIQLKGKAAPNTVVTLYIYSYLPVVVTTTTDANGNWTYDFSSKLADGRHEAYVAVNDNTGKIVKSSQPLAFFVKEANAASEADFLRPDVNVTVPAEVDTRMFVYGGIALVVIALGLVFMIVRQGGKKPEAQA